MLPVPWLLTCSVGLTCHYPRLSFGAGGAPCQSTGCWTSLMTFLIHYASSPYMSSSRRLTSYAQLLTALPRVEPGKFLAGLRTAAHVQHRCALRNIQMDCRLCRVVTFSEFARTTRPASSSSRRFVCSPSVAAGQSVRIPGVAYIGGGPPSAL